MFNARIVQEKVIFEAVRKKSDAGTAEEIIHGNDGSASLENNGDWVKSTMNRLENAFDQETVKQIRMNCQCGYGMEEKLKLVKELMAGAGSLEEFASSDRAKASGLSYRDGDLYLQFPFCPCPMLAFVDRLETKTWCQCTTGYSKVLFEKAFEVKVEVELLKSIKAGDDICLMKIIPENLVWK